MSTQEKWRSQIKANIKMKSCLTFLKFEIDEAWSKRNSNLCFCLCVCLCLSRPVSILFNLCLSSNPLSPLTPFFLLYFPVLIFLCSSNVFYFFIYTSPFSSDPISPFSLFFDIFSVMSLLWFHVLFLRSGSIVGSGTMKYSTHYLIGSFKDNFSQL